MHICIYIYVYIYIYIYIYIRVFRAAAGVRTPSMGVRAAAVFREEAMAQELIRMRNLLGWLETRLAQNNTFDYDNIS